MAVQAFLGGTLFGDVRGENPQVVALHGWARSSKDFNQFFSVGGHAGRMLSGVAFDLPGFGNTPALEQPAGSAEYGELVARVLASFEQPVVLLGHSFGGRVALHTATLIPDKVKALVLTGVPLIRLSGAKPKLRYKFWRKMHGHNLVGDKTMEKIRKKFGSSDYAAASPAMRQVLSLVVAEDYRPVMAAIDSPVELVWGENDSVAPLVVAREACQYFKKANLTVRPGISHLLPTEDPVALYDACVRAGNTP